MDAAVGGAPPPAPRAAGHADAAAEASGPRPPGSQARTARPSSRSGRAPAIAERQPGCGDVAVELLRGDGLSEHPTGPAQRPGRGAVAVELLRGYGFSENLTRLEQLHDVDAGVQSHRLQHVHEVLGDDVA